MARAPSRGTGNQAVAIDPPLSAADEKRFACTHPGCNKRFTRAEHVHRHALNHTAGQYTCLDCRAHFKRQDLLKRHMNRHRQKEQEADGPSGGILNTRKRSWKTLTGEVVERRPYPPGPSERNNSFIQQDPSVAQSRLSPESNGDVPDHGTPAFVSRQAELDENLAQHLPSGHDTQCYQDHGVLLDGSALSNHLDISSYDFEHFQYEQVFQPDTASSFNMPYTTSLDYNWLFSEPNQAPVQQFTEVNFGVVTQRPIVDTRGNQQSQNASFPQTQFAITPESLESIENWGDMIDPVIENTDAATGAEVTTARETTLYELPSVSPRGAAPEASSDSTLSESVRKRIRSVRPEIGTSIEIIPPEVERPLSLLRQPPNIPTINDETRERLLSVIEIANPCIANQQYPIREHPLLSVHHLTSYLELYFTNFNAAYPLLHLASFDTGTVEPLLLLSVLLLGATYSSKDSHQLAVCIHDVIRPSIFAHAGFSPRPQLWTLQTVLLVECFGKSRAGQPQHDMSHLFHGLLINLIRRSDCQSVQIPGLPDDDSNPESLKMAWKKWSEAEEKKRLALLCFMWDTQHAVLFCQSLCMSSFELRITLPCSQSIWEAPDAPSWAAAWRSSGSRDDRTSFLAALKSYLNQRLPRPAKLSALSRVLLLHGLMAIAWDMQRREQTSLGVVSDPSTGDGWRKSLSIAYDTWKYDFDAHFEAISARTCNETEGELANNGSQEFRTFAAAYSAVYHSAKALLNMDFLDIQIYAGSRHILGRPVQQKDYIRSSQVVKRWASATCSGPSEEQALGHPCATTAAWHAARLLQEASANLTNSDAMGLFHVPWCLYLATLTCWAVYHARPGRGFGDDAYVDGDEIVWDPEGDMEKFISSMANAEPQNTIQHQWQRGTTALAWVMANVLTKVRWGIIRSGVMVLRGLVPQRLINQYEEQA
ncbi:hypothetical protein F5Y19DRAFT_143602 [Xylariaceae sp. FL1651]|nr:hypothetical protein F5Y19DRAFT_143602 [Xylariaceae sp. FL1651]